MILNRYRVCLFSALLFLAAFSCFADVKIVSPVSGKWANKQPLVLEITGGETVFYSFSGTDPAVSGFAYDEPVMLDVTGNVELRLNVIPPVKKAYELEVSYSVEDATIIKDDENIISFLQMISATPVVDCPAGSSFTIPSSISYSLGNGSKIFESGRTIACSAKSVLEQYVPCSVKIENSLWRFMIHSIASVDGEISIRSVPFKLDNWTKLTFLDKKLIYSVDDKRWRGVDVPEYLDRGASHIIKWQNVNYDATNIVEYAVIPPQPYLKVSTLDDKSVEISVQGDSSYRIGGGKNSFINSARFEKLILDTYHGDCAEGTVSLDLYADNVYQGSLSTSYIVNRRKPAPPLIVSDSMSSYSRNLVNISFTSDTGNSVYYSVSSPVKIKPSFDMKPIDNMFMGSSVYELYHDEKIRLTSDMDNIYAYNVMAYAMDKWGNKSEIASKLFIIDLCNFFIDTQSVSENPDGSPSAPYKDLSQFQKIVNERHFARFYIRGNINLSGKDIVLKSNCEMIGNGTNAKIILPSDTAITLESTGFTASNIVFEKQMPVATSKEPTTQEIGLFICKGSSLMFNNSEIVSIFASNGIIFNLSNSSLVIKNSGVTSSAYYYTSCVSGIDSKVSVDKCRITSTAPTSVNFSLNGGTFEMRDSSCFVNGSMVRVAELLGTQITLVGNVFKGDMGGIIAKSELIWKDSKVLVLEEKDNKSEGF